MGFTSVFKSEPSNELKNIALFVLVWLWPAVYAQSPRPATSIVHPVRTDNTFSFCRAALVYVSTMSYIVLKILGEWKPCCVFSSLFT